MNRRQCLRLVSGGMIAADVAPLSGCSSALPPEAIAAWQPPAATLEPRRWILSHALLAPHSHNLQSWLVDLDEPDTIVLRLDATLPATDEGVAIANSGYRPNISASADVGLDHSETRPSSPNNGTTAHRGYSINLVQPLFSGLRTVYGVKVAEANVRSGRETLRDTERSILLEAVTAYVDVVRDQAVGRLQENNVTVLTRELKATEDRFAVGEVTRTYVAQAQARRAGSISALDLAKANLKSSRATYERVIGHPPSNLVDPGPPESQLPNSLESLLAAGEENPLIISALYQEEAARHTVDQIRGEMLPSAQLEATWAERFDPSRNTDETESGTVVGRVNVPIYQGGQVAARGVPLESEHGRLKATAHEPCGRYFRSSWIRFEAECSHQDRHEKRSRCAQDRFCRGPPGKTALQSRGIGEDRANAPKQDQE